MKHRYETSGNKDRFAELLSRNFSIPLIRQRMGLSNSSAQSLMAQIRDDLGWQAQ